MNIGSIGSIFNHAIGYQNDFDYLVTLIIDNENKFQTSR